MHDCLNRDMATCDRKVLAVIGKYSGSATYRDFRYDFPTEDVEDSVQRLADAGLVHIGSSRIDGVSRGMNLRHSRKTYNLTPRGWAYLNFELVESGGVLH